MTAAIFGFIGVLFGSISTAALTVYKERTTGRREIEMRDRQYERDRRNACEVFQRDSILALQAAVTDLIGAVYDELDRLIAQSVENAGWSPRKWETPTAKGWSSSLLRLEAARARVFDDELRLLANELRTVAGESIWADSQESAENRSKRLEPLNLQFNNAVSKALPSLY